MKGAPASSVLALAGRSPGFAWLDGGPSSSDTSGELGWFGAYPDLELVGDDVALLRRVARLQARDPEALWIGWLGYDLGADIVRGRAPRRRVHPGLVMRRYPGFAKVVDGGLEFQGPRGDALAQRLAEARAGGTVPSRSWPFGDLRSTIDDQAYRVRVAEAVEHIRAGDTYQVNLSQRFVAPWRTAPVGRRALGTTVASAYAGLRERAPAGMAALIEARPGTWFMSNSPETLVDVRPGGPHGLRSIRSWPIKGTRPRGDSPTQDHALAEALLASEKDRAEHVMIVDLVRNDLGRVCRAGSVLADPPELVSLPTVHHLVSEVRGELGPDVDLAQVMLALWPGGSITGAPKRRTMEIIEALEGEARGIYCGAIVVIHRGCFRASIPIRTAVVDAQGLQLRSGGGVVVDSDPEAERAETIAKARAFTAPP